MCVVIHLHPTSRPNGMVIRQRINVYKLTEHIYSDLPILYFGKRPVQYGYNLITEKFTWDVYLNAWVMHCQVIAYYMSNKLEWRWNEKLVAFLRTTQISVLWFLGKYHTPAVKYVISEPRLWPGTSEYEEWLQLLDPVLLSDAWTFFTTTALRTSRRGFQKTR